MRKNHFASEAEREVLEKLWDIEGGIKQSKLLALFEADGKEWKRQTLNTFLSRLEEKGLVTRENRIVRTNCTREEYRYNQLKAEIDDMYNGRLCDLVAAFVKRDSISKDEAEEMIRMLEESGS